MWFSYYGPINHTEVSEALDAIITSHLQEIGSATSEIPIRRETVDEISVPVALESPPFTLDGGALSISFSSTQSGRLIVRSGDASESFDFGAGLDQRYSVRNDYGRSFVVRFEFSNDDGVKARTYTVERCECSLPVVKDDSIEISGVVSKVSKVYKEQCDESDASSNGLCIICCAEPATVVSYPCRHFCMCRACGEHFSTISNRCPVCRAVIRELIDCSTAH